MTNPLSDPNNLVQEKVWIIPLEFRIKVDDASKYDIEMQGLLTKVLNELRSIVSTFDGNKKQFSCTFLDPIKDIAKFHEAVKAVASTEAIKSGEEMMRKLIAEEFAKLGKKT